MCSKLILLLCVFITTQLAGQNADSVYQAKQEEMKKHQRAIKPLLAIKQQNPDSFFSHQLDYSLTMAYYYSGDTANFFKSANEFINSNANTSSRRFYTKGSLCKHLYYIVRDNHDTLKIIDYAQKRLFIYNRVTCATGEKEFRIKLFDMLINIYTVQGQLIKVAELQKLKTRYIKKDKLDMPQYLKS